MNALKWAVFLLALFMIAVALASCGAAIRCAQTINCLR